MKKILFSVALLVATIVAKAQGSDKSVQSNEPNSQSEVTFGVKGGVNLSSINGLDGLNRVGYQVGFFAEMPVSTNLAIQPNVLLTTKGTTLPVNEGTLYKTRIVFQSIEIPLLAVFKINVGRGLISINMGPYVSYAIGGNATAIFIDGMKNNYVLYSKETFDRLDYGAHGSLSVEFDDIILSAGYEAGFANISHLVNQDRMSNSSFFATMGFRF